MPPVDDGRSQPRLTATASVEAVATRFWGAAGLPPTVATSDQALSVPEFVVRARKS